MRALLLLLALAAPGGAALSAAPRSKLLVVGLGNPGAEYEATRHNAGFMVIDELAKRHGVDLRRASVLEGEYGAFNWPDEPGKTIGLLKPWTYMNLSGRSVLKAMQRFGLESPEQILIVVDETALDLGQVRLRAKGSPNGHNGLRDIEKIVGGPKYPRLRIGVGRPGGNTVLADYVLGEFTATEQKKELPFALASGVDGVERWIGEETIEKAMSFVNSKATQI